MAVKISRKSESGCFVGRHTNLKQAVWASVSPELGDEPDPVDLIALVREGVSGDAVSKFAESINVPKAEVYSLLRLTPRTAQRLVSKKLDKATSDHLVQITKVYSRAVEVFEDDEKAMHWLRSPNFALGNETPWCLLDTTEGIELVQDLLTRVQYGVFA